MAEKRRKCAKCGLNRSERFYVSPRARICSSCKRTRRGRTAKDQRLQDTYAITIDEYDRLYEAQAGRCAICAGQRKVLDVDHDHKAERDHRDDLGIVATRQSIRGLLCRRCNRRLLPACQDKPDVLLSAIDYLTNGRTRTQGLLDG